MLPSDGSTILTSHIGATPISADSQASSLLPPLARQTDKTDVSVETVLWRSILIVEPNVTLLQAEASLLTQSNYRVTPAFNNSKLFILRDTKPVALAILSDRLGYVHLAVVARTVRRQWPTARILIFGQAANILEDNLYDERVDYSTNRMQLLLLVETLYKGLWDQRSLTLNWNGARSALRCAHAAIPESDSTKPAPALSSDRKTLRSSDCIVDSSRCGS